MTLLFVVESAQQAKLNTDMCFGGELKDAKMLQR